MIAQVVTIVSRSGAPVPAKAIVTKSVESIAWPTTDEPIVRLHSQRPPVATFIRERT